jgi:hypothetical protein
MGAPADLETTVRRRVAQCHSAKSSTLLISITRALIFRQVGLGAVVVDRFGLVQRVVDVAFFSLAARRLSYGALGSCMVGASS